MPAFRKRLAEAPPPPTGERTAETPPTRFTIVRFFAPTNQVLPFQKKSIDPECVRAGWRCPSPKLGATLSRVPQTRTQKNMLVNKLKRKKYKSKRKKQGEINMGRPKVKEPREPITVMIKPELIKEIDRLTKKLELSRSKMTENIVDIGLDDVKLF